LTDGVSTPRDRAALASLLARAGFVAADDEAAELLAAAGVDRSRLDALVERRLSGEPLAWITGTVTFCDVVIRVDPHVFVPRWQSEPLARLAAHRLPADGVAVDLCTGSGAIAAVLARARPGARVVATDIDGRAVACARSNGVSALVGTLFDPLPPELAGVVDVVVGVVPYVPSPALALLPHGTLEFESPRSYDGGPDGTAILRAAIAAAPRALRPGGSLLLELGADQAELVQDDLDQQGFAATKVLIDDEGDVRGIAAIYRPPGGRST
jgi:release factor glutamine methyltransferase